MMLLMRQRKIPIWVVMMTLFTLVAAAVIPGIGGLSLVNGVGNGGGVGAVDALNTTITDLGSSAYTSQELIPNANQQMFDFVNHVSISDLKNSNDAPVSYEVKSLITINSVWNSGAMQLLEIFFSETTVSAPGSNTNFRADIEKIDEKPFYASLVKGKIHQLIAHSSRDQSFLNLKRGIASLLQFQFDSGTVKETDVSGQCSAHYTAKTSTRFEKTKTDCSHWDLKVNYRSEVPLGAYQNSKQEIYYDFTSDGTLLNARSHEMHTVGLHAKPDVGSRLESEIILKHVAVVGDKIKQLSFETLNEAVESLLEDYRVFDIEADVDGAVSEIHGIKLKQKFANERIHLTDENIGTKELAILMAELLPLARITKTREFIEILKSENNRQIRNQIVDFLGAVQTIDAHNAIMTTFKFDANDDADYIEKYLQSLAIGTHPDRSIIEDLFAYLRDSASSIESEKVLDTLTQTVASLARQSTISSNDALYVEIRDYFIKYLSEKCSNAKCKTQYIRALQNLQDPQTISLLIHLAKEKNSKVSVAAMQALKTFSIQTFTEVNRQEFEAIFFQIHDRYDSSARTIALDILLDLKPTKQQLGHFLDYLVSNDRNFEVKTYLLQKLQIVAQRCPRFARFYQQTLSERPHVYNYNVFAQKGLTTALYRELSQSPAFNESLISVQEIQKGVLKRGSVELVLRAGHNEISTFKLGIYTSGLSSFVSDNKADSGDDENFSNEDEPTTAGMDISVQGVLLRPLVFFDGQSELMGHIWSGTASESTPAYQATILAEDHEHFIILQSGATVYIRFLGAKSIDLSGQVSMSIWNRNAHTEINQSTGIGIVGLMTVGSSFARLESKFSLASEPKINLIADTDFYTDTKLCIQLGRPEMNLSLRNTKSVNISTQKKYSKEINKKISSKFPGSTLALNFKNNEMCNMIFPES